MLATCLGLQLASHRGSEFNVPPMSCGGSYALCKDSAQLCPGLDWGACGGTNDRHAQLQTCTFLKKDTEGETASPLLGGLRWRVLTDGHEPKKRRKTGQSFNRKLPRHIHCGAMEKRSMMNEGEGRKCKVRDWFTQRMFRIRVRTVRRTW